MITQFELELPAFSRGFHLITENVLAAVGSLPEKALMNIYIKHTSAGLTVNENADPSVLVDYENIFNQLVPENLPFLTHTFEGPDDMPAHIKASLVGSSVNIPISNKKLNLGIWQGIYLCEFRNRGGRRKLVISIYQ
jgi:secondary thiamine-phosphate synthase enzyme